MRLISIALVILGALLLGYVGLPTAGYDNMLRWNSDRFGVNMQFNARMPLVVGGIALVLGLLMLASQERDY